MHIRNLRLLVLAGAIAWGGSAQAKTLVYCSEGSPAGFDPATVNSTTTTDTMRPIFDLLVKFERGGTRITPALAESWEVSPDGKSYTFHLRHGVAFHSSNDFKPPRDFNADDVLYSFERQWKAGHPDHALNGGVYQMFESLGLPRLLKGIEKVDDYTVRFDLAEPDATFLANFALQWASIMSAEYAALNRDSATPGRALDEPVGTGPYVLVDYKKDVALRYTAVSDYWGGAAPVDTLLFAITPDASTRWQKLKANECQVMAFPNIADIPEIRRTDGVTLVEQEGLNIGYLGFNTEKKPFDDKRVRQAMNMAIDRQAIIDAIYGDSAHIAKNPIPPSMWSYNDKIEDYSFDPERARALLAAAGYADGFATDLWAMPVQRPYNPNARRMAEMMQQDLAKVGVSANIVTYEWAEYLKRAQSGEHTMILLGWTSDTGDPDNILNLLLGCDGAAGGSNMARWCDADYDALVMKARMLSGEAERTPLYEKAQEIFKEEAPWLTLAHAIVFVATRDEVKGYKVDPFGGQQFYGVDIDQ